MDPPPPSVVRAFGGDPAAIEPLPGGITESTWRAGDVVLKPHDGDAEKALWCAEVFAALVEDGFRIAQPVRTAADHWLDGQWTAHRWVPGIHRLDRWHELIDAVRAFHVALPVAIAAAGVDRRPAWQDRADHIYAQADRVVFFGAPPNESVRALPGAEEFDRAVAAGPPLSAEHAARSQLIHGDPASNALWDSAADPPFLIDMSPSWRPADTLDAQILVEAVLWFDQPVGLLATLARSASGRAATARICAYRLYTRALAEILTGRRAERVARYTLVLDFIDA